METVTPRVFGLKPWFPWPISRWRWLNDPIRAERLAALRIGVSLVMLLDVVFLLYPMANEYFGAGSLGEPPLHDGTFRDGVVWSVFQNVFGSQPITNPSAIKWLMGSWMLASLLLLIGLGSRLSAVWCFVMSVSVCQSNPNIDNAGDTVRSLILLFLMLSPCGAAWSIEAWLRRRYYWSAVRGEDGGFRGVALMRPEEPLREPFFVQPWPLRLLFVQMMAIYLFNGVAKASGNTWHQGRSLHDVLGDLTLARWSYAMMPLPFWMTSLLTRMVLWWEVLFVPVMLIPWRSMADWSQKKLPQSMEAVPSLFRWTREIFLVFGALFHVGIWINMELGGFAPYMLCLYLPLIPWERSRWATCQPAPVSPG